MIRKIMSEIDVVKGLKHVWERIEVASSKRPINLQKCKPRLVAVSKTKPKELIIDSYNAGQRHFGENYVQELVDKAHDPEILEKCPEICWHFIGLLQRNKVNKIVSAPNLYLVETVESEKVASSLNTAWLKSRKADEKLRVMVQVNTSGEEEKNGCSPAEVASLVKFVLENCKSLEFVGIMTIGKYGYDTSQGLNPDFLSLVQVREEVCKSLGLCAAQVELSMGMSDDFEQAIELGSTNVRVGSSIFGYREKKPSTKITEKITEGVHNVKV
uniref:Pyridoxal phosphate homeostasis protein n=1 Tax=Timema californicum TaxID=61474 RepID=A0A7R9J7Y3_TIMCA|nr:unnamed protein product [Timema californicum]